MADMHFKACEVVLLKNLRKYILYLRLDNAKIKDKMYLLHGSNKVETHEFFFHVRSKEEMKVR
jgi:hypothetical protein